MRKLKLDQLKKGLPGITKNRGGNWHEAIITALSNNGHISGTVLNLDGEVKEKIQLIWSDSQELDATLSWNDLTELVEAAATGVALLLVQVYTPYKVSWRARKGDKVDYFLSKNIVKGVMKADALLEVSGILKETKNNRLSSRVGVKQKQAALSPFKNLPTFVVVIEFGTPKGKFLKL